MNWAAVIGTYTYRAVGAGFEQCSCSTPHAVTHEHRRVSTVTACRL